ncbi:prolyl oligopeptidase family serine peptidase [Saccharicrinis sp. 156]|uniref:S9 family peptidase n=1 Tax=Saccharicrinis sp. 156 TaxID=3417574 RepID=UPI003D359056
MTRLSLFLSLVLITSLGNSQHKKTLSFKDYDHWKSLSNQKISNNGKWISYEINPQKGDGYLYLYNVDSQRLDSVPRGKQATFSPENDFIAFKVIPQADTIRALQLKKTKSDKMPKDTLCVWNLLNGEKKTYPRIKAFTIPQKQGNWLAAHFHKSMAPKKREKSDTTAQDTTAATLKKKLSKSTENKPDSARHRKKPAKKFKTEGTQLVYLNPTMGDSISFENVSKYFVPEFGDALFISQSVGDSLEETKIKRLNTNNLIIDSLFHKQGKLHALTANNKAEQIGFLFSPDTVKTKTYRLYYWRQKKNELTTVVDTAHNDLPVGWCAHTKGRLWFSENGDKLFFGTGKRPKEESKDTLLKDEKVFVDVWNWKDTRLQPMQKKNISKEKDRAYVAAYLCKEGIIRQLETEQLKSVDIPDKGNWDFAIGYDRSPYEKASSWNGVFARDIYTIDLKSGKKTLVQEKVTNKYSFSPDGKYLCWFNPKDSLWHLNNIRKKTQIALNKKLDVAFYDELNDVPNSPQAYGVAGWSPESAHVYIYDRYDIWKFDTKMKTEPLNLTRGMGRKHTTRYRYKNLDKDIKYIDETQGILLNTFNESSKNQGYGWLKNGIWNKGLDEASYLETPVKAKKSDQLIWRKGTFNVYPELYLSALDFANEKVLSNTNPQQKDYNWGNIQLVDYTALDGKKYQGLLVTPEDLDTSKKYPMIVYYYERSSDRLNYHHSPRPSRSTVNWTMYASNGYVIFIPDIAYRTGDPGLCAYEAIMGGVMAMTQKFDFIDEKNMGLQGQSWGGYQTAYMITRTNMFKAAMAGAPVSNMTSAYGGIRWGSGMSRMFQYEHTQSRIGGTLWDKFSKYVENSPVFYAPQIETPLLMMHNDNDGAVPWYQGIEMFVAMRRLDKPAWMLTYNNEQHNLTRRANSIDLSIRMMQFFDHYLKGKPAPVWMQYGIPAVEKGKNMGYDLVE